MNGALAVGFIGFGEAGFEIAKGLHSTGVNHLFFCHLRKHDPERSSLAQKRGREAGATYLKSTTEVVKRAELILSVVPPEASVGVAEEAALHLRRGQLYLDLTSSFPGEMKAAAARVEAVGADFVDGAMMGSLPIDHHRVLIYVAGSQAGKTAEILNGCGMNLKVVGQQPGQASAIKLLLSIVTKGLEALLVEMLLAAHHYKVEEPVLLGLQQFFAKGIDSVVNRFVASDPVYSPRRVKEMESSVRLLRELGVEPIMSQAIVQRLQWSASLALAQKFGGIPPAGYKEVIQAWEEVGLFGKREKETQR